MQVIKRPSAGLYKMLIKWVTVSTVIGAITGILVSLLELSVLDASELMLRNIAESGYIWLVPIMPFLGLTVTGVLRDRLTKLPHFHGTEEVLEAYHYRDGDLILKDVPIKTIGSVLSIGSGVSAGLEGPSIHIGGAVGVLMKRFLDRLGIE
ncbi:MAG: chloride channel protein, partial [Candidatus Korarchaeota archaeon]|nr:chloride channel protein [Candidatus Korarchaeota archaeon]